MLSVYQVAVLRTPYGASRYRASDLYTYGFTGQRSDDTTSGLDYYGARYYDPLIGQFTSADTDAKGGLNRYGYVADDPETATDPTGHRFCTSDGSDCSGKVGGGGKVGVISSYWDGGWFQTGWQGGDASNNYTSTYDWGRWLIEKLSDGTMRKIEVFSKTSVCDQHCSTLRDEAGAKHAAQQDTQFFRTVEVAAGVISAALALLGVACWAFFAGCGGLAALIPQIVASLGAILLYAKQVADAFDGVANHTLSWYTESNISQALDGPLSLWGLVGVGMPGAGALSGLIKIAATGTVTATDLAGLTMLGAPTAVNAVLWNIASNDELQLEDISTTDNGTWVSPVPTD